MEFLKAFNEGKSLPLRQAGGGHRRRARPVAAALTVKNPAALRVTMLAVLSVVWAPTFKGLLQGLHRFASLGWLLILEGVIRLGTFILLVNG